MPKTLVGWLPGFSDALVPARRCFPTCVSLAGDDTWRPCGCSCGHDFYPRLPRGRRPWRRKAAAAARPISIHVSREGDDGIMPFENNSRCISIHVSREGDDACSDDDGMHPAECYSRLPRGRRQTEGVVWVDRREFLSTSPARETTLGKIGYSHFLLISIHVSREGDDSSHSYCPLHRSHFYPRLPRGRRLSQVFSPDVAVIFLSTSPARETTRTLMSRAR